MNMDNTTHRYTLESPAPGLYEARDNKTGVFVTFEEGKFDETQEWYHPVDAAVIPEVLKRTCDGLEGWLRRHYLDAMTPEAKYSITLSEDGTMVTFSRKGNPEKKNDPHIEITFPAFYYRKNIVAKLNAMVKFLRDDAPGWNDHDRSPSMDF